MLFEIQSRSIIESFFPQFKFSDFVDKIRATYFNSYKNTYLFVSTLNATFCMKHCDVNFKCKISIFSI